METLEKVWDEFAPTILPAAEKGYLPLLRQRFQGDPNYHRKFERFLFEVLRSAFLEKDKCTIILKNSQLTNFYNISREDFYCLNMKKANLSYANFFNCFVSQTDFEGANLRYAQFNGTTLHGPNFSESNLNNTSFYNSPIENGIFKKNKIFLEYFRKSKFTSTDFYKCRFSSRKKNPEIVFNNCKFKDVDMSKVNLSEADCSKNDFLNCNFSGANLAKTDFSNSLLAEIDVNGADLMNTNFESATLRDIKNICSAKNLGTANFAKAMLTKINMSGISLKGTNFQKAFLLTANFTKTNLTSANLTGTNLSGADLTGSDLTNANLTDANLTDANLTGPNLTGTNLTSANLTGTNLSNTNLTGANLTGANLTKAVFFNTILKGTQISFDNLLLSKSIINIKIDLETIKLSKVNDDQLLRFKQKLIKEYQDSFKELSTNFSENIKKLEELLESLVNIINDSCHILKLQRKNMAEYGKTTSYVNLIECAQKFIIDYLKNSCIFNKSESFKQNIIEIFNADLSNMFAGLGIFYSNKEANLKQVEELLKDNTPNNINNLNGKVNFSSNRK